VEWENIKQQKAQSTKEAYDDDEEKNPFLPPAVLPMSPAKAAKRPNSGI
jgi:hypothetical protein